MPPHLRAVSRFAPVPILLPNPHTPACSQALLALCLLSLALQTRAEPAHSVSRGLWGGTTPRRALFVATRAAYLPAAQAEPALTERRVPAATTASGYASAGGEEEEEREVLVPVPEPAPEREQAAPQTATVTEPNGDTVTLPLSALSALETRPRASPPPHHSPPHPPPPRLALEPALPQPLDLVGAHQALMADKVTVPATATADGAKASVSVKPAAAKSAAAAKPAVAKAAASSVPVVVQSPPPARTTRHAFGLTGFAFWTLFWFGFLSLCVLVNVGVRRVTRGGRGVSAQEAAEAAAEAIAVLITTSKRLYNLLYDAAHARNYQFPSMAPDPSGSYGSLGQTAPRRGDAARARSAAALGLTGDEYKSGSGSRGRSRERSGKSGGRRERGGRRDEDAAPEEYMMSSLTRGGTGGAPSVSSRSVRSDGGKERSRGRTPPPPSAPAPAWEELYRRAPETSTKLASALLKSLGKGKKALFERSWVAGEEGALGRGAGAMPKLSLSAGPGGVVLSWTEARFSAPLRCELQSCRASLDSPQLRLETASGPALLQPPDEESFAEWVLGLNAAFHTASCAEAAAGGAPEEWAVGKEEMEQAAIGLPWHPAVFLGHTSRSGVLGTA